MKICSISLIVIFNILLPPSVAAQSASYFQHYSTEDGLPQNTVMGMLQDHKGFMWFATWDGFSKFDGYSFQNYKVRVGDIYQMESNRIQHIFEDKYGYIWLHTYDNEAHCFNPYIETFRSIRTIPKYEDYIFSLSEIKPQPSGKVWLLSKTDGCICVVDSTFTLQEYNKENGRLKGNTIYKVFEDLNFDSWILSDNGLSYVKNNEAEPHCFFFENNLNKKNQSFFDVVEFGGELWFASNTGRIWRYSRSSLNFELFKIPTSSDIKGFQVLSKDEILITTDTDGFFVYNLGNKEFAHYNMQKNNVLKSNNIRALYYDSQQQFWFETEGLGVYKFDTRKKQIKFYFVKVDDPAIPVYPAASKILEDIYNQIWVHPRGGGFAYFDKQTDRLIPFNNSETSTNQRFSNILHSLFSDKQGNLWFCSRSKGVEKIIFDNNKFQLTQINSNKYSLVSNNVRAILQDQKKRLWVATKDKQLTIYDENYNKIGTFSDDGTIGNNLVFSELVYNIMEDVDGNIWLGTRAGGLYRAKKTNNPLQYQLEHFKKKEDDLYSLSDNVVFYIYQDSKQNIWIGTYGGGLNLVRTDKNGRVIFINHKNNLKNYPINSGYRIRYISENKYGNICVGTTTGLIMFSSQFSSTNDIKYKYYKRMSGDKFSLGNNDIQSICNTRDGDMFLATLGGGLNKVTKYDSLGFPLTFRSYTTQDGLPTDVCLAIMEDEKGNLWVSMENHLSMFNPKNETFKIFAEIQRLISHSSFSESTSCKIDNGNLVFGTSNGLLHFQPNDMKNSSYEPYIALSGFRLHNQLISTKDENSPLTKNIDDMDKLILSKEQNSFSIGYAALDFILTDNISYAYKLEGFDKDWIYVQKQRIANYMNVPKGSYVFRVRSTNGEGVWVNNEHALPITILPTFWETPVAIGIYILLFVFFLYLTIRILFTLYKLRRNVEIERHLSELKMRFFTDISHEIRTPLTMISAPVDYLLADSNISASAKKHLHSISQNANRMLRLVNQILDLRKIQNTQLKVQEINLSVFLKNICVDFDELAQKQNIDFSFVNEMKDDRVWLSPNSLEIIMMNLLSNAFKYTPHEKKITVIVKNDEKYVWIEVRDEGCGISKEKQKMLFKRFVSFSEDKTNPSTGLGLSIVKNLLEKHGGVISVESELTQGSVFTVKIIRGIDHYINKSDVEIIGAKSLEQNHKDLVNWVVEEHSELQNVSYQESESVLIVEDNAELRDFIRTILEQDYIVITAENGVEGLLKAEVENPDIIVSDIMMPCMDGITLLQELKENIKVSHIPVVLLTAKTALEYKLEGLKYGADDYITKPFSATYFSARIKNILEQRKRLQSIFQEKLTNPLKKQYSLQPVTITSQDDNLMKQVMEIIEKHIDDSEFTIENLCSQVNMSRSTFSNKIKGLTGLPPFEFIRNMKMKRAAQLLSTGEFMIKEVSFMIGISDVKHFGKIFKSLYGISPLEYKKQYAKDISEEDC